MFSSSNKMRCPFCRRFMPPEYSHCPTCGKFVHEVDGEPTSIRSLLWRALLWFLIMLLVIGALIYLRYHNSGLL